MKTIFKSVGLGVLLAGLFAIGGARAFGQDQCADVDGMNAVYQDVLKNYKSTDPDVFEKAINSGKQFLEKYGSCDVAKQNADWVKGKMPGWEARLPELRKAVILQRFDTAVQAKSWDDAYAAGNEYLTKYPNDDYRVHVIVPMGWIGYVEALNKNYKYDANSMKYSKMAIDLLKAGNLKAKPNDAYGTYQLTCTGREECISLLTFGEGYMTYFGENNKQAALPYYYEVSKLPGSFAKNPAVYGTIGDFYYDSVKKLGEEVKAKIADQKDNDPDDVKAKKDADIKASIAMLNGYAERAMDAYSRAYTIAKADPKNYSTYTPNVYKVIQTLYTIRFQNTKPADGVDSWISSAVTKPFPDPTSPVTPIEPETNTGTTGEAATGTANTAGTSAANAGGAGAVKTTAAGAGTGTSTAAKTVAAKPIKPRK